MSVSTAINSTERPMIEPWLESSEHRVDVCVLFTLMWVAHCDGTIQPEEARFILDKLPIDNSIVEFEKLVEVIESNDQRSYELVFSILQDMPKKEKDFLLELAVGTAVVDGDLNNAEHLALEFLADLVGGGALKLKVLHKIIAGKDIQSLGDPSSVVWWNTIEGKSTGDDLRGSRDSDKGISANEALQLLGLGRGASEIDIRKAHKRRLQSFHPDRFESQGEAAKQAAQEAFLRVQQAYEVLKK